MTDSRISKLGINLKVKDFEKSKAFYDTFGFKKLFEFGPNVEEKSKFRGLFYDVGSTLFEISEGHLAVKPEVFEVPVQNSKVSLMVYVDSLVQILNICEEHDIEISVKPREFPWGQIGVVIKDPDDFVVVFLSEASLTEKQQIQSRTDVPLIREEPDYSDDHVKAVKARN